MSDFVKSGFQGGVSSIELVGDSALIKQLKELENKSAKSIMRPAINAGLNPILKRARSLARQNFKSKTISKHIKKYVKAKRKIDVYGAVYVADQPDRTIEIEGRKVPFEVVSNILEFGRKDGSLPARSFMRRAREEMAGKALEEVARKAKEILSKKWSQNKLKLK